MLAFDVFRFDNHTFAVSVPGACLILLALLAITSWRAVTHHTTYHVQKGEEPDATDPE